MSKDPRGKPSELTSRAHDTSAIHRKRPYKVVLESVSQEKKNLRSVVSYNAEAPAGYTFVPAGNPELTDQCKEFSRTRGLKVYVVSAAPKNKASKNPENISHHIHRIGHHFDNQVVDQACDWLGIRTHGRGYTRNAASGNIPNSGFAQRLATHSRRLGLPDQDVSFQQRNQQVRETIRDLFPRIPDVDVDAIIARAFQEGTSRVGNAEELSLPRRVQLATVAHIRHVYTDYDQLLKSGSYHSARAKVEQACLDQLVKWRGENDTDVKEVEDIFREVIVLDDEDDENDSTQADKDDRELSLEIVYSQAAPTDLQVNALPAYHQQDDRGVSPNHYYGSYGKYRPVQALDRPHRELPPNFIAQRYTEARLRHQRGEGVSVASPQALRFTERVPHRQGDVWPDEDNLREPDAGASPTQSRIRTRRLNPRHNSGVTVPQNLRPVYVPEEGSESRVPPPYEDTLISRNPPLHSDSRVVYRSIEDRPLSSNHQEEERTRRGVKRKRELPEFELQPEESTRKQPRQENQHRYPLRSLIRDEHFGREVYPAQDFIDLTDNSPRRAHEHNLYQFEPLRPATSGMERLQLVDRAQRYDPVLQQPSPRQHHPLPSANRAPPDRYYAMPSQGHSLRDRVQFQEVPQSLPSAHYVEESLPYAALPVERVTEERRQARFQPQLMVHPAGNRTAYFNNGRVSPPMELSDVYQFQAGGSGPGRGVVMERVARPVRDFDPQGQLPLRYANTGYRGQALYAPRSGL